MKIIKIFLILMFLFLVGCFSEIRDKVVVESIENNTFANYKYRVKFKTYTGYSYLYTNTKYSVGDTLDICK